MLPPPGPGALRRPYLAIIPCGELELYLSFTRVWLTCPVSLLRYTTKDFVSYSAPHLSLYITNAPGGGGTPTVKSLARNDDTVNSPPHPSLPAAPPSHNRTA